MSELLKRFENLTLNSSEEERNTMQGYVCKVKNNFLVIPDPTGSKFVLCGRKYLESDSYHILLVMAVTIWFPTNRVIQKFLEFQTNL